MTPETSGLFFSWAKIAALAIGLIGGGFAAGIKISGMQSSVDLLRQTIADRLATKSDVETLRSELSSFRTSMLTAKVHCPPYVVRGQTDVACALSFER